MGLDVEEEPAVVSERCGVTAMVGVLVIHHRGDALAVEPMGSAEPGHAGSHYDDVWHWHVTASPNFYGLDFVTARHRIARVSRYVRHASTRQSHSRRQLWEKTSYSAMCIRAERQSQRRHQTEESLLADRFRLISRLHSHRA